MDTRIHITTAIIYSNGPPHVGHAYEVLATDAFARFQRRKLGAANVSFVTGTDEHGDKNKRAADAAGLHPKAFADNISAMFKQGWAGLDISYDYFVRTTDPVHQAFVQKMLARSYENGDIHFKDYEGLYCVGCERFYTEKELLPGNVCPVHNTPVEPICTPTTRMSSVIAAASAARLFLSPCSSVPVTKETLAAPSLRR